MLETRLRLEYDRAARFIAANAHMALPSQAELYPDPDGGFPPRFMGVPCFIPEGAERIGQVQLIDIVGICEAGREGERLAALMGIGAIVVNLPPNSKTYLAP